MKKFVVLASLALLVPTSAFAGEGRRCGTPDSTAQAEPATETEWAEISLEELASMLEEGSAVPVDANRPETRDSVGIIPGAILLAGSDYDTEVLASAAGAATLVFYCYNERCGASHQAAHAALAAGYSDVRVLPAGIIGWVEAGQELAEPALNW